MTVEQRFDPVLSAQQYHAARAWDVFQCLGFPHELGMYKHPNILLLCPQALTRKLLQPSAAVCAAAASHTCKASLVRPLCFSTLRAAALMRVFVITIGTANENLAEKQCNDESLRLFLMAFQP